MKRATLQLTVNSICCSKVKGVDEDAGLRERPEEGSDEGSETVSTGDKSSG